MGSFMHQDGNLLLGKVEEGFAKVDPWHALSFS